MNELINDPVFVHTWYHHAYHYIFEIIILASETKQLYQHRYNIMMTLCLCRTQISSDLIYMNEFINDPVFVHTWYHHAYHYTCEIIILASETKQLYQH